MGRLSRLPALAPSGCLGSRARAPAVTHRMQSSMSALSNPGHGDALLIKVSGQDSPGITSQFTEMLSAAGCEFYDIDQPWCQPWCTNNVCILYVPIALNHKLDARHTA